MSANAGATLSSDPVAFYIADKSLSPGLVAGQLCRAWVNFNGTGTVAIRASGNVSSITDNGTGNYTVTFTTAMVDANYCAEVTAYRAGSAGYVGSTSSYAAGSVEVRGHSVSNSPTDIEIMAVAIFR
jgi:hypothetical protein